MNMEGIVVVLDVGPTMGQAPPGTITPLDVSLKCINMLIQRKIFLDPKDEMAMILFGTDDTYNNLAKELADAGEIDQYQNISILRGLTVPDWDLIEELGGVAPCNQHGDVLDAIVVAIDHLKDEFEGKKFKRFKVLVFTDLEGGVIDDEVDQIISGIKDFKVPVDVKIICPFEMMDEDHANNEPSTSGMQDHSLDEHQKPKSEQQIHATKVMKKLLLAIKGHSTTLNNVSPSMEYYRNDKIPRAMPWKVNLKIGSEFEIPVVSYKKISEIATKTWKKVLAEDENISLMQDFTYHLNDEVQTTIEKDETIPAYCYGSTLVPFSDHDKVNMEFKVESKCLSILGFTSQSNIKRHHFVGIKVDFVVPQADIDEAAVALSAIIHGLYETKMVAIARYVYSGRSSPKLVALFPRIKSHFECLVSIQLPFMEDLRQFTFSPLNLIKKNIPTESQLELFDSLITEMDLTDKIQGNFTDIYDPCIQRLYQCMSHRVNHPTDPLPEVPPHLKLLVNQSYNARSEQILESIKKSFDLEEIVRKEGKKTGANVFEIGKEFDTEPANKRSKWEDDNLDGGIAGIINNIKDVEDYKENNDAIKEEEKPQEEDIHDEADDLLDMM